MEDFIQGTCELMCPQAEIELRTRERLLHYFERDHATSAYKAIPIKMVKEFSRSAAGTRFAEKNELRTPDTLWHTTEYLIEEILLNKEKPFNVVYDFLFDRFRAIRQDIVMQNLSPAITVQLMEPIILFLAYSAYRLIDAPHDKYDPKICHQHLQECIKKVLFCYDELDAARVTQVDPRMKAFGDYNLSNRELIESLYLIFNLGSSEALSRIFQIPKSIGSIYLLATKLSLAHWDGNFYKCLIYIKELPHLLCGIAALKMQSIRREMLLRFVIAYQNKVLSVPIMWLQRVLAYDNKKDAINDLQYYNIKCDLSSNSVMFNRSEFATLQPVVKNRSEYFIDCQFDVPITNIILSKN